MGVVTSSAMGQKDFEKEWKQVQDLIDKGLPQSALEIVDSIYTVTKAENNSVQFLKAALYQLRLRSDYQEDYMETGIRQFKQEIAAAQEPVRQVLHSILAEIYWRYYQVNRYKFLDRTTTTTPDPEDIRTWDLRTLTEHTTLHFEASLANPGILKQTTLEAYDPILIMASGSKDFRPTLYDFLAHRALDYFMNEEASLAQPADRFELDKPGYFLPAADFPGINITSADETSLKFRALQILQGLLDFHLTDEDPKALIDVDLKRLAFVRENSILPNKQELYIGALKNLGAKYAGHPSSTEADYHLAMAYSNLGARYDPFTDKQYRWELKKAKEICEEAVKRFPEAEGAKNCRILHDQLTGKEVQVTMREANLPSRSILAGLTYKNLDRIYLRIIRLDPEENRNIRQRSSEEAILRQYLGYPAVTSWEQPLPDEGDLQSHQVQIKLPAIEKGFYIAIASASPDFSPEEMPVVYASFWVTNISYSSIQAPGGTTDFFVLDRDKGTPLARVTAKTFVREYDYSTRTYTVKEQDTFTSDKSGFFSIPGGKGNSRTFFIKFIKGDDYFYTDNYFYQNPKQPEEKVKDVTHFFTDRAIYRPGQTIYFKGILLEKKGNDYHVKAGESTLVGLYDVNNQKISELLLNTNEYGSFSGTFTAPTAVLTGMMQIRNESGRTSIQVEEYKRPRFEVKIDPLEGNYRLDEIIHVTGNARSYAGTAIDRARVKYRVVRQTIFPYWRSWWYIWPEGETMEITNGYTETDENGQFSVGFKAIPDLSVNPETNPVFNYTIYVDVTDINSETHSVEKSVSVSKTALYINSDLPEKLDLAGKSSFQVFAKNLNGRPVNATGSIFVYPLEQPAKVLRERAWERPDVFVMDEKTFNKEFPDEIYNGEDDPNNWDKGEPVFSSFFDTERDSLFTLDGLSGWKPGTYLLEIKSVDAFGEEVVSKKLITAFSPDTRIMPENKPFWVHLMNPKAEPGEMVSVLFGTAEKDCRVLYEVVNKDRIVSRQWLEADREVIKLDIPVEEAYRGNFSVRFMFVRGNRGYTLQEFINVPYTNKELDVRLETFRDKLYPGQEEEWRIRISGKQGDKVAAELLASMYDASLDVFAANTWSLNLYNYYNTGLTWSLNNAFSTVTGRGIFKKFRPYESPSARTYDQLNWFGFNYYGSPGYPRLYSSKIMNRLTMAEPGMAKSLAEEDMMVADTGPESQQEITDPSAEKKEATLPEVPVRRNFEETAFFFPQMKTDENGDILLKFNVPESLTAWKFMGLAVTKDLMTGYVEKQAVTRKELMVMPNPPRFFREGDKIAFSSKVVSLSEEVLQGTVKAEFFDALTMKPVDDLLGNDLSPRPFTIEKGRSQTFSWEIVIPVGMEAIACRIVAVSEEFSDGEEQVVPVLPNRMLVTETLPLPVNGKGTRNFSLDKLVKSGSSKTIRDYGLTLEFTSNPAWYAVQALPYLMENERESADALFMRLYANSLASWIAGSSPKIKMVFDNWKNLTPDALLSNLEKNEELKSVLLQETPWVLQARNESEQKKRIALLFDLNRMANEQFTAVNKLMQMQLPNGGWPWFEGMKDSPYITQSIISGTGKLHHLGVIDLQRDHVSMNMVRMGIYYMDQRVKEDYEKILERHKDKMDEDHLSPLQVQYLYGRSFFMDMVPLEESFKESFGYFQGQAAKYWLSRNKYLQGMIALALNRLGDLATPGMIIRSLKENSLVSEELGMYWRENNGYYWHELPVERQSMLIEAFTEVSGDMESVEMMKVWLLKQKQVQMWETSRATAEAVYALLLRGTDILASDQLVQVTLGNETIDPFRRDEVTVEAGTGYFQTSWAGASVKPEMGKVKVVKEDDGVAWGALYWQYFEDLDKITAANTPLSLEKKLFREDNTPTGPVLNPVGDNSKLATGDKVVVRIILRVDRDMEFVHMKDMRAAAFEPVSFLSGYRYQGGLGYYEAPKDASMNFYFDYLRKGTYVFEYGLTATQQGEFSNGITTIQCLYAPEFSAHSEGLRVVVK